MNPKNSDEKRVEMPATGRPYLTIFAVTWGVVSLLAFLMCLAFLSRIELQVKGFLGFLGFLITRWSIVPFACLTSYVVGNIYSVIGLHVREWHEWIDNHVWGKGEGIYQKKQDNLRAWVVALWPVLVPLLGALTLTLKIATDAIKRIKRVFWDFVKKSKLWYFPHEASEKEQEAERERHQKEEDEALILQKKEEELELLRLKERERNWSRSNADYEQVLEQLRRVNTALAEKEQALASAKAKTHEIQNWATEAKRHVSDAQSARDEALEELGQEKHSRQLAEAEITRLADAYLDLLHDHEWEEDKDEDVKRDEWGRQRFP
jgi:flagellar biosynthesis GTPase FlhF